MPPVQTSYSETHVIGYAGAWANETNKDADSKVVETEAGIGFGLAVSRGSADKDKGCVLGGTSFIGVTVRSVVERPSNDDKYAVGEIASVATEGDIFVAVTEAVDAGDAAYYNSTTGTFNKTSGGNQATGAKYVRGAAQNGIAVLRLP